MIRYALLGLVISASSVFADDTIDAVNSLPKYVKTCNEQHADADDVEECLERHEIREANRKLRIRIRKRPIDGTSFKRDERHLRRAVRKRCKNDHDCGVKSSSKYAKEYVSGVNE